MKRRWVRQAAVVTGTVALAAVIATGCGGDSTSAGGDKAAPAAEQVLKINIGSDPEGFDPAKSSYVETFNVLTSMFAGLYRFQGADNELEPYLAAEMPKVSDDGLTYTVKLRDNLTWSNGDPLTADDVVFGVQYALRPSTGAYFASFMTSIVGACEIQAAGNKDKLEACGDDPTDGTPEQLGVKALDDTTVEFKLRRQVPWFEQLMTAVTFWPLHKESVEKFKDKWTLPENIVTSGPFTLASYDRSKQIVVKKNPKFFDAEAVKLKEIQFTMISDPKTAAKQFELGKIDSGFPGTLISPADIEKWKTKPEYMDSDSSSVAFLYLNTTNDELKDPKVRQGIAVAINRPAIVENINKKGDVPLNTLIPTVIPGYDTIKEGAQEFIGADSEPDIDKAKELLKQGGWKDGTELSVYYASEAPGLPLILQSVQSDLEKVGVKIKLVPTPGDVLMQPGMGVSPVSAKVDILSLGWAADYLDAQNYYQLFTCDNIEQGLNSANFCDKEYDKLYEEALTTVDQDARFDLYKQLEAMLTGPEGMMPAIPMYQPVDTTLVQTWVKGFKLSPSSAIYYDGIEMMER